MDILNDKSGPHITVQPSNVTPPLEKCGNCCSSIHCPFCSPRIFKPTVLSKVRKHLEGHKRRAVQHKGYTIFKCNLICKEKAHFHCLSCKRLFDRRDRFLEHLLQCNGKEEVAEQAPTPTANCSASLEDVQYNDNATENQADLKTDDQRNVDNTEEPVPDMYCTIILACLILFYSFFSFIFKTIMIFS